MNLYKVTLGLTTGATYNMNLYKVTLGLTTGATYNMTNVHVFKAAQARRAYFLSLWVMIDISATFFGNERAIIWYNYGFIN